MYYNTKASGARIRELRLAKKLDQIELAELLNVSHGYISRIESGKKGCSVDLLIQLSGLPDSGQVPRRSGCAPSERKHTASD